MLLVSECSQIIHSTKNGMPAERSKISSLRLVIVKFVDSGPNHEIWTRLMPLQHRLLDSGITFELHGCNGRNLLTSWSTPRFPAWEQADGLDGINARYLFTDGF
jgi:hypothetical protein